MTNTDQAARRLADAALKTADALDGHPDYADRADSLRAAAADLRPPERPLSRDTKRAAIALTAWAVWVTLAPALLALVLLLSGCSWAAYVRAGDPCDTIGDTARSKTGYAMVCKEPASTDPTGTPRWRRA